jgi:hypothetical protein
MSPAPQPFSTRDGLVDFGLWLAMMAVPTAVGAHTPWLGALLALGVLSGWLLTVPVFRGIGRFYGTLALLGSLVWRVVAWAL